LEEEIMQAYSQDLRDRVMRALERGDGPTAIAGRLEVSRLWVYKVKARWEQIGERSSHRIGGHRVSRVASQEKQIREWIDEKPDLTLAELCERLREQKAIELKAPALWHQLDKWGLSLKKNAARQRARAQGREAGAGAVAQRSTRPGKRQAGLSG
jgi:transposase